MRLALLGLWAAATFAQIDATKSGRVGAVEVVTTARDGVRWATLRNTGSIGVKLRRVIVYQKPVRLGTHMLALSGWQAPSRVKRSLPGTKIISKVVTGLYDPGVEAHAVAGFLTFDRISTQHELENGIFQSLCDFEGWTLAPGQSVQTETLWVTEGDKLAEWATRAAAHYRPKLPTTPPAGWVGWSWVDPFNVETYEQVALRNAQAIRDRLPGLPINYLWVSLGNLPDRRPGAWLDWNTKLFPSGREHLRTRLDNLGFQLGLWSGAFWLNSELRQQVADLEPAFLRKDGEPLTAPHKDLGKMYLLDPTHPMTHDSLRKVFAEYRRWGVRYYMIDFLNAIGGSTPGTFLPSGYADAQAIPGPATYRQGIAAIREGAGPDTFLLSSTGPTFWNIGLMEGIRAGSDYGEGRPLDGPGKGFWPGTFMVNQPNHWTSHRAATDALASHSFLHRKLFWADTANVLTVGQPMPVEDAQIGTTIFGLNGGQIMLGDEIAALPPERLRMIRMVFPRQPEAAQALDLFRSAEPNYPKVFHLPVKTAWDTWDLYAVFNYGKTPLTERLPVTTPSLAWDFWKERYLGTPPGGQEAGFDLTVPSESVRLVRISRKRDHPWVAGTNLNVRQGQSEITGCRWSANTLTVAYDAYPNQEGHIFVHAPAGWVVENPLGLSIAKDANDSSLIIGVPVRKPKGTVAIMFRKEN
jgi:hypothetical protein